MKNFYVCRKLSPLILASAITIHKSQGLSLDSSVVDLSEKVFGAGMAYVALSRVHNLSGLHLIKFHPNSVIVSRKCILELNQLRQLYRPDLPLYDVPAERPVKSSDWSSKATLTGEIAACNLQDWPRSQYFNHSQTNVVW